MADKQYNGVDQSAHTSSWLDGLPHGSGWGPQTPDPDEAHGDAFFFVPDNELTWGGDDDRNHHVWRFDGRRHHRNHH